VLAIDDEEAHARHFWVRDHATEGLRPVHRYLDALPDIRFIQSYIVDRAERAGVPVIENSDIERTIAGVMELVLADAEQLEAVAGAGR
jgi:2-phosphoglycerate kinase